MILHADLGLLPGFGQQQLAGGIDADDRIVACGVGRVGRDTVVEVVDQAGAAGKFAVLPTHRRINPVVVDQLDPVVAARQDQRELIPLDLVLQVEADLSLGQIDVLIRIAVKDRVGAIDRVEKIQVGRRPGPFLVVERVVFEIEPDQRGVPERARGEAILELIVQVELCRLRGGQEIAPREVGGLRSGGVAHAVKAGVVHIDVRRAAVLAERRIVGEAFLELITDHVLRARVAVDGGVAGEQVRGYPAERSVGHGAFIGQPVQRPGLVVGRHGEDGQSRVCIGQPGHGRRDEIIVVVDEVGLRAAALDLADDPVENLAVARLRRDGASEVELGVGVAEIVDAGLDIMNGLEGRLLAHGVDQPAR